MNKQPDKTAMRQAATVLMNAMLDQIPKDISYDFSEAFLERTREQIRQGKRMQSIDQFKKAIRIAILVLVLTASFLILAVPSVRASISGWFRTQIEDVYSYFFSEPAAAQPPKDWDLGWVPDGYEIIYDETTQTGRTVLYQNGEQYITFTYFRIEDGNHADIFTFDDEYTVTTVQTANKTCDLYISRTGNDTNALVWMDTQTGTAFIITSYLKEAEILRLIENLRPKP